MGFITDSLPGLPRRQCYFIHSGIFHSKFVISSLASLESSIKPGTRTDVNILILFFNIIPFGITNDALLLCFIVK